MYILEYVVSRVFGNITLFTGLRNKMKTMNVLKYCSNYVKGCFRQLNKPGCCCAALVKMSEKQVS